MNIIVHIFYFYCLDTPSFKEVFGSSRDVWGVGLETVGFWLSPKPKFRLKKSSGLLKTVMHFSGLGIRRSHKAIIEVPSETGVLGRDNDQLPQPEVRSSREAPFYLQQFWV